MKDILINENNDVDLVAGDFPTCEDTERILQHIKTGLFIMPFDWVLDWRVGVDYVNGLRAYPRVMIAQIKNAIKRVYGVDNVLKFNVKLKENQTYELNASVKIGNSEIPVNNSINYGANYEY